MYSLHNTKSFLFYKYLRTNYIRVKFSIMESKSRGIYWLLFFASIALCIVVYLFLPSMTSLTVVPLVTTLVKALDLIWNYRITASLYYRIDNVPIGEHFFCHLSCSIATGWWLPFLNILLVTIRLQWRLIWVEGWKTALWKYSVKRRKTVKLAGNKRFNTSLIE